MFRLRKREQGWSLSRARLLKSFCVVNNFNTNLSTHLARSYFPSLTISIQRVYVTSRYLSQTAGLQALCGSFSFSFRS